MQIVAFDQNMLDLSEFSPKDNAGKDLRPRERYISDLLNPDMTNPATHAQLRADSLGTT